jgi:hypothetical protein
MIGVTTNMYVKWTVPCWLQIGEYTNRVNNGAILFLPSLVHPDSQNAHFTGEITRVLKGLGARDWVETK